MKNKLLSPIFALGIGSVGIVSMSTDYIALKTLLIDKNREFVTSYIKESKINLLVNKFYNIVENTKSYKKIVWQDGQGGEFEGDEGENIEKENFFETIGFAVIDGNFDNLQDILLGSEKTGALGYGFSSEDFELIKSKFFILNNKISQLIGEEGTTTNQDLAVLTSSYELNRISVEDDFPETRKVIEGDNYKNNPELEKQIKDFKEFMNELKEENK